MLQYRLTTWARLPLPEAWLPLLAQVETVVEHGYNAVMQGGKEFGNSTDAVRFGITIFFLFAGLAALAILYERKNLAEIRELKTDNKTLRDEIRGITKDHDRRYEELRDACDKKTDGYWGLVQVAVKEVAALTQALLNAGVQLPRQPLVMPPPPQESAVRSQFLPAGPRRVPRRKENEED